MTGPAPLFRVVHGNPSVEETAALAVALAAKLAAGHQPARRGAASRWADRARSMRAPLTPGPDAWRTSSQPR
jgi:acyl-CoA carboxylase epsilon subunit